MLDVGVLRSALVLLDGHTPKKSTALRVSQINPIRSTILLALPKKSTALAVR